MQRSEQHIALVRHAAQSGDWQLTRALADFLEQQPSRSMIAACCAYISLCEELAPAD